MALAIPVWGAAWEPVDRLADVRLAGARALAPDDVRGAGALVELPWTAHLDGVSFRSLVVGPGWVQLGSSPLAATFDGARAEIDHGSRTRRIEVLSGPAVTLPDGARVMVLEEVDRFTVRWAALSTPLGPAVVEMLLSRRGDVDVQFLHVPAGSASLVMAGSVRSEVGLPASGTAYRSVARPGPVLLPPTRGPFPRPAGPDPPMGCAPETTTWCDEADGVVPPDVFLQENFNDGQSGARGWFGTGDWHETTFDVCPPGATSDPGIAWWFGTDALCSYQNLRAGSLVTPAFGPLTTTTLISFASRIQFEGAPFDFAEIWMNGQVIANMPSTDDGLWYTFTLDQAFFAPFIGQVVQMEFLFQSDGSATFDGWRVDDVVAWDTAVGNPGCVVNAGSGVLAPCDQDESTRWSFNEGAFCAGCTYTLYALVECGREMHLPLFDVEGADIRITNVATGQPVSLHCVNETARADAGMGAYRAFSIPSGAAYNGPPLDCCPPPGDGVPELWWAPAFDVIDNAGAGHVRWGLDDGCPIFTTYDVNLNGVQCNELPATCGGVLANINPGESQVMDCFISEDSGLCGLYRIDVTSGGFVWDLFANCDGTGTPQFQIFHDCAEAWQAFNPLPELAIANLTTTDGCPDLMVSFDVVNLGCVDQPAGFTVRIQSNCASPDVLDHVVLTDIPAGESRPQLVAFRSSCSPVRVEVVADPANAVDECTESTTAAACRADQGVDSLATFTCGCTAQLTSRAGADVAGCGGSTVTLDAVNSTISPCATPEWRWLDSTGRVVQDWSSTDSSILVLVDGCPGSEQFTAEVRCQGEDCSASDTVEVRCIVPTPVAPDDFLVCDGHTLSLDASMSSVSNCATPEYQWLDRLGRVVRPFSPDPVANFGLFTCADAGDFLLEVRCAGTDCVEIDTVRVGCVRVVADAGPDVVTCEGEPFTLTGRASSIRNCMQPIYGWFDGGGMLIEPGTTLTRSLVNCPGGVDLFFVAACDDVGFEDCPATVDVARVSCTRPAVPVPAATPGCGRTAALACGVADPMTTYAWDLDVSVDSDVPLDGDPANDADRSGCNVPDASWPAAGPVTARATATDANGCTTSADVIVDVFDGPSPPMPTADPGCAGETSALDCGGGPPGLTHAWDYDLAVDSDVPMDGNPANDVDSTDCAPLPTYGTGDHVARLTVTDVATGCSASADVLVRVPPEPVPGEVVDERVTRNGDALTITWPAVADAATYRVARGNFGAWDVHVADPAASRGTCDTGGATTFTDPDDAAWGGGPVDWYYLVTAVSACGVEGPSGEKWTRQQTTPREPRTSSASCP